MTDYLVSLGTLGFTYRTRRLADRIFDAGRRFYDEADLPLEPNWHALLLYLDRYGPTSVTTVASALKVSHPAVIDMARRIEAAGLIVTRSDPDDGRRRVLALSDEGRRRLPEFKAVWDLFGDELDTIIEATAGSDAIGALTAIEAQLDSEELDARVRHHRELGDSEPARVSRRATDIKVRPAEPRDREAVLHIARELVRTADTYAYEPDIDDDDLWHYWCPPGPGDGFVAEHEGQVVGTFVIRPNHPGPGSHVANASYAVRADVRGIGLGRRMGEASLGLASDLGYSAMQFNIVVSTNTAAVRLWRSLGFRIVGTIPDGFRLPDGSFVSHHVMYRSLA